MKEICKNKDFNSELEKSFSELARNFQSYLISLPPLVVSTSSIHVNGAHKIYHMHPLLVQLLIAMKAIFMNHVSEERTYLSEVLDQKSFKKRICKRSGTHFQKFAEKTARSTTSRHKN
jgi:hypothetical protein